MRTAEDRAEAVNEFIIHVDGLVQGALEIGYGPEAYARLTLKECSLQNLLDVLAELREAKLARARLEFFAAKL